MENEPEPNQKGANVINPNETQPTSQGNQPTPNTAPSGLESSKKFGKKAILLTVLTVLVVGAGAALIYIHFHKSKAAPVASTNASTQSTTKTTTQPAITYSSVLVFQRSSSTSSSTTSILGLDGSKLASFSANASDATFDGSFFSQANLELVEGSAIITTNKTLSSFALVTPDGKSTPIASSLNTLLAANPNPATSLSNGITIGKNTLLALENTSSGSNKLVKINLTDGTTTNLFSIVPTKTGPGTAYIPVELINTSRDGKTAYLLTNSVKINSTAAANSSLVTVDLTTGKYTIKSVPPLEVSTAAVSNDGKYVAYVDVAAANKGYATATTHIFNVQTGKDTPVMAAADLVVSGGAQALRFSNDGAYLSVVGSYAPDTHKNGMELQIISTSSDAVVQKVDREGAQYEGYGIEGFGWASDHTMIYATNSSPTGYFGPSQETVHSMDASTGKTFDFPASGELLAVLNYQN